MMQRSTHIFKAKTLTIPSQKKMKNKSCSTVTKEYADKSLSVEPQELGTGRCYFQGFVSLQNEEQLVDLTGVSYGTFDFLLQRTLVPSDNCKFNQKRSDKNSAKKRPMKHIK